MTLGEITNYKYTHQTGRCNLVIPVTQYYKHVSNWGSFHKAILATIDLSYLRLILRLPALIFTSVPRNNFKMIVNPTHVKNNNSV